RDADPEDEANLTAKGLLHEEIFPLPVSGVAFSPDGKRLAAGLGRRARDSKDGAVAIFDLASWKELARLADGSGGAVTAVAFSPAGNRLAAGSTRPRLRPLIHLWATKDDREELPPLELTGAGAVDEIVFSPDGSRLAVAHRGQRAAVVDVSAWQEEAL